VQIVNTGAGPLNIISVVPSGAGCGNGPGQITTILPAPQTLNTCETAPVIASYNGTTVPSSAQCTVTITTDAGNRILQLVGTSQ
jgi:hypothetical protein